MTHPNRELATRDVRSRIDRSVCDALRRCTHDAHVRINHHPFLAGLTRPGYPILKYQSLLSMYWALYSVIEDQIESFLAGHDIPFEYEGRRKRAWLLADLTHLSLNMHQPDGVWSQLPPLQPLANVGALIGTLYVIEGATLGGQVISRHLQDQMGLQSNSGARFFNGYGNAMTTRSNWQQFCDFANSIGEFPALQGSAEQSAVYVFELIENQLDILHARIAH